MLRQKNLLILCLGVLLGVLVSIGGSVLAEKDAGGAANSTIPFEGLKTFSEVYGWTSTSWAIPSD